MTRWSDQRLALKYPQSNGKSHPVGEARIPSTRQETQLQTLAYGTVLPEQTVAELGIEREPASDRNGQWTQKNAANSLDPLR